MQIEMIRVHKGYETLALFTTRYRTLMLMSIF